jgi:phosphatidate cytidylyltransferase
LTAGHPEDAVTDRRDEGQDEEQSEAPAAPARGTPEGVRILGAEEAQAAMDAGTVGRRLGDQDPRYGDVPPRPDPAIRPSARFPLSADEPAPDVHPRSTPAAADVTEAAEEEGFEQGLSLLDDPYPEPAAEPDAESEPARDEEHPLTGIREDDDRVGAADPTQAFEIPALGEDDDELDAGDDATAAEEDSYDFNDDIVEVDEEIDAPAGDPQGEVEIDVDAAAGAAPALPHWSEPPTGEMPLLLPEAEPVDLTGEESLDAYTAAASTAGGPRFLTGVGDWAQEDVENFDVLGDEETNVGALASAPEDDDTAFKREVAARRKIGTRRDTPVRVGGPPPSSRPPRPPRTDDELMAKAPSEPDLTTRVITGVGLAVLALICLKLGRTATTVLVTAIVGLASLELFQGLQKRGFRPATALAVLGSLAIVPLAYQRGEFAFPFTLAIVTVFTLLWYLFEVVKTRPTVNVAVTVMGFVYVGALGGFAGLLLSYQNGVGLLLGVILCVVAYDIVGYIVGSQFGKRRLAPEISPNKTMEGLIGGMLASVIVALAIVRLITPWTNLTDALALGITVAVMAPLGDLCESMIKRDLGVKDFGSILPGHGGILDRFDGILFCLPAVYYLARALTIG